jgi:hypothetical protein
LQEHDKQLVTGLASMRDLQVEVREKEGYIRSLKHEILDSKSRLAAQNMMLNSFSSDLFQVRPCLTLRAVLPCHQLTTVAMWTLGVQGQLSGR